MTDQHQPTPETVEDDLPEQMRVRREKRERLSESGHAPYPIEVERTHTLTRDPSDVRRSRSSSLTPGPARSSASSVG